MLKNYLKSYLYLFISILSLTIIFTIINYFFPKGTNFIKIIIPIISILISTIILGKNTKSKAYLEGLKFTLIYIVLSVILFLIFKNPFTIKVIILYIVQLLTGIIGATIGINTLKKS